MKSKISLAFENCKKEKRPALITYTVAGDNNKNNSFKILNAIAKHSDICELSFVHNCPIADGSQIQNSSYRALMGYYNLIYQMGENNFLKNCNQANVDGLIVVDLPWPENKNFAKKCKKKSISFVQLLSPTTTKKRMKKIVNESHDMIYYISMLSTTGGKLKVSPKNIMKNYNMIKRINPKKNLVIGFGITDKNISYLKSAQGLVCGSFLCKTITNSLRMRQNPVTNLVKVVYNLRKKTL